MTGLSCTCLRRLRRAGRPEELAQPDADLLRVARLDDGGVGLVDEVPLQRRPPQVQIRPGRVADQLRRVAADADDVFEDDVVVAEVGGSYPQPEDRVREELPLVLETRRRLAAERQVYPGPAADAGREQTAAGLPALPLVLD